MIIIIDTETSDLPIRGLPADDPQQPFIVDLAVELLDMHGFMLDRLETRIRAPEGRKVRAGAERIHGISSRNAGMSGIDEIPAMGVLIQFARQANFVIGWNLEFDKDMVTTILRRRGKDTRIWTRPGLEFIDLMKIAAQVTRLVPADGPRNDGGYKWPTLDEACAILLDEEPRGEHHSARDDLQRTKRVFTALRQLGLIENIPPRSDV